MASSSAPSLGAFAPGSSGHLHSSFLSHPVNAGPDESTHLFDKLHWQLRGGGVWAITSDERAVSKEIAQA